MNYEELEKISDEDFDKLLQGNLEAYHANAKSNIKTFDDLYLYQEKLELLSDLYKFSKAMFPHMNKPMKRTEIQNIKSSKVNMLKSDEFLAHPFQIELCKILTMAARGVHNKWNINLPPATGKSFFTMVTFPLWEAITNISFRAGKKYILISRDDSLRKRNMYEISNICMSSYFYHMFKDVGFGVTQINSSFIQFENGIQMFTSNLSITGHHPAVILGDDILDLGEAYSKPLDTETKIKAYLSVIGSRGMTQYRRLEIYTGHGVKPDDLVDRLRKRSKLGEVINGLGSYANIWLAAYFELDNICKLYKKIDGKIKLIWQDYRTEQDQPLMLLDAAIENYATQREEMPPQEFAAQYQQRFDVDGHFLFKSSIDPIIPISDLPKLHKILWGVDFAYSTTKTADYTVFVQIGVYLESGKNPIYYVLDCERFKSDNPKDILDKLKHKVELDAEIGWASMNGIPKKKIVVSIPFDANTNMTINEAEGLFELDYNLVTDKPVKSKEDRAMMLASFYNKSYVKIIDSCENLTVILKEIRIFNPNKNKNVNSIHDDCVDALVTAFNADVGKNKKRGEKLWDAKVY